MATRRPPDSESPELPQYEAAQRLLTNPMKFSAEKLELVAGDPSVVNYHVDGVRYDGEALDRNAAGRRCNTSSAFPAWT